MSGRWASTRFYSRRVRMADRGAKFFQSMYGAEDSLVLYGSVLNHSTSTLVRGEKCLRGLTMQQNLNRCGFRTPASSHWQHISHHELTSPRSCWVLNSQIDHVTRWHHLNVAGATYTFFLSWNRSWGVGSSWGWWVTSRGPPVWWFLYITPV